MPGDCRFIYWDSCVPLTYIQGDKPEDLPILDRLLEDSESRLGDIRLITATLSVAEVAFAHEEQVKGAPDPTIEAKIDALWESNVIRLVDFHLYIAKEARALVREARLGLNRSLKPPDAIHLATARFMGAAEFHTYDEKLWSLSPLIGIPILKPYTSKSQQLRLEPGS